MVSTCFHTVTTPRPINCQVVGVGMIPPIAVAGAASAPKAKKVGRATASTVRKCQRMIAPSTATAAPSASPPPTAR